MQPGSIISGTFKQQNAALYLGFGFLPDWVRILALTTDTLLELYWSINMRSLAAIEGVLRSTMTDADWLDLAYGEGVALYNGGDVITASTTPSTTTYLEQDRNPDKRAVNTGYDPIDTWTLGSAANRTGNWNAECSTTYVGVGSRICVDGRWATIVALTSNGEAANEITLNAALPSGNIEFIGPMYDFCGQETGVVTKAGILISDTTYLLDAATDMMMFEAGSYR